MAPSDRSSSRRAGARGFAVGVDLALFTPNEGELGVLLRAGADDRSRSRLMLPSETLSANETLDQCALNLAKEIVAAAPAVMEQVGTFTAPRSASSEGAKLTVLYFGLLPAGTTFRSPHSWLEVSEAPASLAPRQREEMDTALSALRARIDQQPIAFRLLPQTFTLSELQRIYELLLGRRLHKASFRRALHAASLVEATDEWRSEGRGRPAQLFRYAPPPPRRRRTRRGVRFDAIG
jgi:ADP-ribose pyrophosphatase YjhB (NUDIX family)